MTAKRAPLFLVQTPAAALVAAMDEAATLRVKLAAADQRAKEAAAMIGEAHGFRVKLRPEQARELVERGR